MVRTLVMLAWVAPLALTLESHAVEKQTPVERAQRRIETLGLDAVPHAFARSVALQRRTFTDLFLEAGVDPNQADENGRTPLFHAVAAKDWKLADRLLAAGADPKLADSRGVTPLMLAAAHGREECVRALLDRGAVVNGVDQGERTALRPGKSHSRPESFSRMGCMTRQSRMVTASDSASCPS